VGALIVKALQQLRDGPQRGQHLEHARATSSCPKVGGVSDGKGSSSESNVDAQEVIRSASASGHR
jgi:hypothetical protein